MEERYLDEKKIRIAMLQRGVSRADLERHLARSRASVWARLTGRLPWHPLEIRKLCQVLLVDEAYLAGEGPEEVPPIQQAESLSDDVTVKEVFLFVAAQFQKLEERLVFLEKRWFSLDKGKDDFAKRKREKQLKTEKRHLDSTRIKIAMKACAISDEELVEYLAISLNSLRARLNGRIMWRPAEIERLAKVLGVGEPYLDGASPELDGTEFGVSGRLQKLELRFNALEERLLSFIAKNGDPDWMAITKIWKKVDQRIQELESRIVISEEKTDD